MIRFKLETHGAAIDLLLQIRDGIHLHIGCLGVAHLQQRDPSRRNQKSENTQTDWKSHEPHRVRR
jgi:hypothetical protein